VLARDLAHHDDTPLEDKIVVLRGLSWSDYQRMLEVRGDARVPRFAYLQGDLEVMRPSRPHESIKSNIGTLVEVWCMEMGVEFSAVGSWTLEDKASERGIEPDECYIFGDPSHALRPDLAIEVVWTSGGVRKLDIYAKLGVAEVWFWRRGRIEVYLLNGESYEESTTSRALPGIDLSELVSFLDRPTSSQGMREYRALLASKAG
jgi:Uma2 family endonuclease